MASSSARVSRASGRRPAQSCAAEEMHGAGGEPVHQRRLVEEADAVDVGRDEVVAQEHLAGDLEVDGVDVVEQAGSEEAADVEDEPGEDDERDRAGIPGVRELRRWCRRAAAWGAFGRSDGLARCIGFRQSRLSVECQR